MHDDSASAFVRLTALFAPVENFYPTCRAGYWLSALKLFPQLGPSPTKIDLAALLPVRRRVSKGKTFPPVQGGVAGAPLVQAYDRELSSCGVCNSRPYDPVYGESFSIHTGTLWRFTTCSSLCTGVYLNTYVL